MNNGAGENLNETAKERVINHVDAANKTSGAGENKPDEPRFYPKTPEGKKRSAMNATKHGMRSAKWRVLEKQITMLAMQEREARKLVDGT
ncbi:MAG: hypothetical protein JMN24_17680 [gamma proteobacterium endosymbiont of Lamellibrachia anaximandri]|nr:hypothetical protein [gamma proteobacterium endosymbiont of Lamellibrachia anaximandri]MBL3619349.1 hypothetical protein [gamma proteobacterium endosymbiont of Lamellibrachia anaximandri]